VSNFVETEQVVESQVAQGAVSSHVLLRGSMPLFWQEGEALVTLKPQPTVIPGRPHEEACAAHLAYLQQAYGKVVVVSLLDERGPEASAFAAFRDVMRRAAPEVHFEAFDFHKECGKHASARSTRGLQKLLEGLGEYLEEDNVFVRDADGQVQNRQKTFFRVNCIDCLDRTNVIQALFALRHLVNQLSRLSLLDPALREACVFAAARGYGLPLPAMEKTVKHAWADMGDAVSLQYAGTRALKGDFTRTGKRTLQGVFTDGLANVRRAVQNNFADGFRQTVIDRVQGKKTESRVLLSQQLPSTASKGRESAAVAPGESDELLADLTSDSARENSQEEGVDGAGRATGCSPSEEPSLDAHGGCGGDDHPGGEAGYSESDVFEA